MFCFPWWCKQVVGIWVHGEENGGAGLWFITLKHIWCVTYFTWKRDVRSGIDVVPKYFCFLIFVMRLCRAEITSADANAYFCCSAPGRYEDQRFVKGVVALSVLKVFHGDCSYFSCVQSVSNVSNFLHDDMLWLRNGAGDAEEAFFLPKVFSGIRWQVLLVFSFYYVYSLLLPFDIFLCVYVCDYSFDTTENRAHEYEEDDEPQGRGTSVVRMRSKLVK